MADSLDGATTPGKRLYLIRLACGDGARTAETLEKFAERVKRETGETYYANALSLLERDIQNWRLSDATTLAKVDPKERGRVWLAAFDVEEQQAVKLRPVGTIDPASLRPVPRSQAKKRKRSG